MCVRDLYKKIKEILSQPNTERIFDITDTQLLELHESIDEKFEMVLTNNPLTESIFNDATAAKTARRRVRQVKFDFRDAQRIYEKKVSGKESQQVYNDEGELIDEEELLGKRNATGKRISIAEAHFKERVKNRP